MLLVHAVFAFLAMLFAADMAAFLAMIIQEQEDKTGHAHGAEEGVVLEHQPDPAALGWLRRDIETAEEQLRDLPGRRELRRDADAVERVIKQDPDARILWAHSGFDRPENVPAMLEKHPKLWADLAFRTDHASGGKVNLEWRAAFLEFPERFMVGTDSFTPERLHYIAEHARWSRQWLGDLPKEVAEQIGYRNGEQLFGGPPQR